MPLKQVFWMIMIVWALFYIVWNIRTTARDYGVVGVVFLIYILFCIMGWRVFGPAVSE